MSCFYRDASELSILVWLIGGAVIALISGIVVQHLTTIMLIEIIIVWSVICFSMNVGFSHLSKKYA